MGHKPTEAQLKIFDFVKNGKGNGIIDAVAGAGKTSTLMGCVMYIPNLEDVIYCAFNTSIRKELQKKFHAAKKEVKVCTIHSLGFQMLRATKDFKLDDRKYNEIIKDPEFFESLVPEIDRILGFHNHPTVAELKKLDEMRDALDWDDKNSLNEGQQYVGKIVKNILDINQKYRCTLADDNMDSYDQLVKHFGIFQPWEYQSFYYKDELACYFRAHQKLLKEGNSIAVSHGMIDYTDQLYLPYVLNLTSKKKFGFVFVDECQDLSRAQLYVVKQYLREDGRLMAVGDPYQSIYGFAGADCESFERVKNTFNCSVLGLTDCFRCPQDVIKIAKSIRPDINGFKQYPGKIYKIPQRQVVNNVKEGDLIICRTRKPLLAMALKLITKDFKVKIHPDELQEFMGDYKRNFTPQELRKILTEDRIDDFFERARQRNEKRIIHENQNADSIIRRMLIKEAVTDMENVQIFLKKKFFEWHLNTLESILTRLKHTLSYPGEEAIKISSIHRAKGLENNRVFILEYNKLPFKRELEWEQIQERNLHYVAVTRPMEELYLCEDQLYTDGDEDEDENTTPAEPINNFESSPSLIGETGVSTVIKPMETSQLIVPVEVSEELIKNDQADEAMGISTLIVPIVSQPEIIEESLPEPETIPVGQPSLSMFLKFKPTQKINKIPAKFYSLAPVEDAPFPALNMNNFQKVRYWSIFNNLQDTEFSINNVVCTQYLDTYYISTPNGIEIYNGRYNGSGQYTFAPKGNCINADQLMCYLTDESNYKVEFEYQPYNFGFEAIHKLIQAACQELGICNTNIYEEQYTLIYCFKTPCSYAYIKVMYNGRKVVTTIMPYSTLGENDDKLNSLLETLQHLWQM